MTVIVEGDAAQVELFRTVLGTSAIALASVGDLQSHLADDDDEYAVVLGPSVGLDQATALAEEYRVGRPSLGVILVRSRVDSSVLAGAMRAGVREVVESRDMTGLATAVGHAYNVWQAMTGTAADAAGLHGAKGQLFTVFSTKGGVGKSMIATNLATALAHGGHRVCLVDLDVQAGDVAIMMHLHPLSTLADFHSMVGGLDPSLVESLLTRKSDNLSVLAAPLRLDAKDHVSPDAVSKVLQLLKAMFDVVVVDTSGTFDDYALNAFDHSDALVLVGTLDIPALKNLKLATDTIDLLNIPRSKWRLVLNRADDKVGLSTKEFEETLGVEIAASLPSSREVLAAVNRGEAIVLTQPRHPVSQGIQQLADRLMAVTSHDRPAGRRRAPTEESRLGGLLRRRVH